MSLWFLFFFLSLICMDRGWYFHVFWPFSSLLSEEISFMSTNWWLDCFPLLKNSITNPSGRFSVSPFHPAFLFLLQNRHAFLTRNLKLDIFLLLFFFHKQNSERVLTLKDLKLSLPYWADVYFDFRSNSLGWAQLVHHNGLKALTRYRPGPSEYRPRGPQQN